MRAASKRNRLAALAELDAKLPSLKKRAQLACPPSAIKVLADWEKDLRERIEAGELGACTTALARSYVRVIEDFESGFYVACVRHGPDRAEFHIKREDVGQRLDDIDAELERTE